MKVSSIIKIILAVLGVAALGAALYFHLTEADVPYDDVGAFYHLSHGLRELFLWIAGGVLLLGSGIWAIAGYWVSKKKD